MSFPRAGPDRVAGVPDSLPRSVRMFLAAAALLFGALALSSQWSSTAGGTTRNEFTEDYVSARAVRDGLSAYGPTDELVDRYLPAAVDHERAPVLLRNPHTPAQILLSLPFGRLNYSAARRLWLLLSAAALIAAFGLTFRRLGWNLSASVLAGIGLLASPAAQLEMAYGNVNSLVLLLIVVAWSSNRSGRSVVGGISLGVAAALKVFPLLLFIPLARKRDLKAIAYLCFAGAIATLGGLMFAGQDAVSGFRTSTEINVDFWRGAPWGISLTSFPFRWLTRTTWTQGNPDLPSLALLLAVILGALCLVAMLRTPARRTEDVFLAAVPWAVLASALAWDRYVLLAIPVAIVVLRNSMSTRQNRSVLLSAVIFAAALVPLLPGLPSGGEPASAIVRLIGYGFPTAVLLALGISDFRGRRQENPAALESLKQGQH